MKKVEIRKTGTDELAVEFELDDDYKIVNCTTEYGFNFVYSPDTEKYTVMAEFYNLGEKTIVIGDFFENFKDGGALYENYYLEFIGEDEAND